MPYQTRISAYFHSYYRNLSFLEANLVEKNILNKNNIDNLYFHF